MIAAAHRKFFVHTGTHKTGTTALQAYLAEHSEQLYGAGFSYVHSTGATISLGNGQHIAERIFQNKISDVELESLIENHFNDLNAAICSSEDFTALNVEQWKRLRYVLERLRIQLYLITYVRNVGGYYMSIHNESIKIGITTTSLADFCAADHYKSVIHSLKSMLEVFPKDVITVLHYDSNVEALEDSFIQLLGGYQDGLIPSPRKRIVNRSLTAYEKNILTTLNAKTGGQHAKDLSNYFLSKRPNLRQSTPLSDSIVHILQSRHADDIDWINETFFQRESLLKIAGTPTSSSISGDLTAEDAQSIDRDLTAWLLEKLHDAQERSIEYVAEQLRQIDWNNAGHLDIPETFDPFAYLLMNPDILRTGRAPYEHFITCGRFEGRKIEWSA